MLQDSLYIFRFMVRRTFMVSNFFLSYGQSVTFLPTLYIVKPTEDVQEKIFNFMS